MEKYQEEVKCFSIECENEKLKVWYPSNMRILIDPSLKRLVNQSSVPTDPISEHLTVSSQLLIDSCEVTFNHTPSLC